MNRKILLEQLLDFTKPILALSDELNKFKWDCDEHYVTLSKFHLLNILNRYLKNELSETEVEEWANAVESREDIGINEIDMNLINETLYELANPYLTTQLSTDRAKLLIQNLNKD